MPPVSRVVNDFDTLGLLVSANAETLRTKAMESPNEFRHILGEDETLKGKEWRSSLEVDLEKYAYEVHAIRLRIRIFWHDQDGWVMTVARKPV